MSLTRIALTALFLATSSSAWAAPAEAPKDADKDAKCEAGKCKCGKCGTTECKCQKKHPEGCPGHQK